MVISFQCLPILSPNYLLFFFPVAVAKVNLAGWSSSSLELAAPFDYAHSLTAYNGKFYIVSANGWGIAIVDETTFLETPDSPFYVSGDEADTPCYGWNINQYNGVRTSPSLRYPCRERKRTLACLSYLILSIMTFFFINDGDRSPTSTVTKTRPRNVSMSFRHTFFFCFLRLTCTGLPPISRGGRPRYHGAAHAQPGAS
jgi:hypothetical protein